MALAIALGALAGPAHAGVVDFFTDRDAFEERVESSTLVDFEDIVADNEFGTPTDSGVVKTSPLPDSTTISDVTFTASGGIGVTGPESVPPLSGGDPLASAALFASLDGALIRADLPATDSPVTAVGALFGHFGGDDTWPATLRLFARSGPAADPVEIGIPGDDEVTAATLNDRQGITSSFFGWVLAEGWEVVSLEYDLLTKEDTSDKPAKALDDFVFGTARAEPSTPIPEPGTLGILGLALAGLGALRLRGARSAHT